MRVGESATCTKTGDDVEWRATRQNEPPLWRLNQLLPVEDTSRTHKRETTPKLHVTGLQIHGKGLVRTYTSAIPCAPRASTSGGTSERSGLKLLLTPQGKALLEDFNPCVSCELVVEYFQDAILLSDKLLDCPRNVQRWCVMGLAPGEESGTCRQQIGQWASKLLRIWSRRWIHLNLAVVWWLPEGVFPFRPPVNLIQKLEEKECGAADQL